MGKAVGWIVTALGTALGLVTAILTLFPWLSVEPAGLLDPANPYTVPFVLSNDGFIPLVNVKVTCWISGAGPSGQIRNNKLSPHETISYLSYRAKVSLGCFNMLSLKEITLDWATFVIKIDYRPYILPLYRGQEFKFVTAKTSDGSFHWLYAQ